MLDALSWTPRRYAFRWSLKRKLAALVLCTLLPTVIFGYYLVQQNVESTKHRILSGALATSDGLAFQIDDFVESTERMLKTLGKTPVVQAGLEWDTYLLVREAAFVNRDYEKIFAANANGEIYASSLPLANYDHLGEGQYLAGVVAQGKRAVYVGAPARAGEEPVVTVIVPIRDDDNQPVGALGAQIALDRLERRLTTSEGFLSDANANAMVIDPAGRVLFSYPRHWAEAASGLLGLRDWQRQTRGAGEYVFPGDGERYLAAYSHAGTADWAVVVAYTADSAYSPAQEVALTGLAGLAVTTTLALLLGLFVTTRLAQPICDLTKKAAMALEALPEGRVAHESRDEVRELKMSVDAICAAVRRYSDELALSKEELAEKVRALQELGIKAAEAQAEERQRLAQDIHDGVAQLVHGALALTRSMRESLSSADGASLRRLDTVERLLDEATVEVTRMMLVGTREKSDGGLAGTVHRSLMFLQETSQVQCHLSVVGVPLDLSTDVQLATHRIVQEALNNVRRHAAACQVHVVIKYEQEPPTVKVSIEDDGKGFDVEAVAASGRCSLGLSGMRARAQRLGAALEVLSQPGRGTGVYLTVPIETGSRDRGSGSYAPATVPSVGSNM